MLNISETSDKATKDNLKVPFYTHSIQNNEDNLSTKDKRLGHEHVRRFHCSSL